MFNGKRYKIEKDDGWEVDTAPHTYSLERSDPSSTTNNAKQLHTILKTYKSLTLLGKIVYGLPFLQDLIKVIYNIYKYE
jgi:hypothetical protein